MSQKRISLHLHHTQKFARFYFKTYKCRANIIIRIAKEMERDRADVSVWQASLTLAGATGGLCASLFNALDAVFCCTGTELDR